RQLAQPHGERLDALRDRAMRDRSPRTVGLISEGRRVVGVPFHGVEEQLGQGSGAHGSNLTTKVTGDPGTAVPTARRPLAVTVTLPGLRPATRPSLALAGPPTP